jgi:thiol-disulfide isomerase/thioredoxin
VEGVYLPEYLSEEPINLMTGLLRYTTIALFILLVQSSFGQNVKVYNHFEEFKPLLQQRNDTTYVVNFWATWCKPCVEEMPFFLDLNKKFSKEKFKMILVSLDFEKNLDSKVKTFIKNHGIKAEVVLLTDTKQYEWIDEVNQEWSGSIPVTIIFNKNFYFFKEGSIDYDKLNEIITKQLKQ